VKARGALSSAAFEDPVHAMPAAGLFSNVVTKTACPPAIPGLAKGRSDPQGRS